MLVLPDRFFGLPALQVWYPDDADAVIRQLKQAPVVSAMQCSPATAERLEPYAFRSREFHTLVMDLTLSEEQLWERLEKKTCRYQLNKAKKLGGAVTVNEHLDAAFDLFDDFFRRKPFRPPLARSEWQRIVGHCDVFVAHHDGAPIAAHVVLKDPPRARALMSATADRADAAARGAVSALNRHLHWHEFNHYRARGLTAYDFGGIVVDENAPEYAITEFKLTFNGERQSHRILRLAGNALFRTLLRGAHRGRAQLHPSFSGT